MVGSRLSYSYIPGKAILVEPILLVMWVSSPEGDKDVEYVATILCWLHTHTHSCCTSAGLGVCWALKGCSSPILISPHK